MLNGYKEYFPKLVQDLRIIGYSYLNQPIYAICFHTITSRNLQDNFTNTTNSSNIESSSSSGNADILNSPNFSFNFTETRQKINSLKKDRSQFLITADYRGSDFISVSMALYLIKYLIYGYVHGDSEVSYILENRVLWLRNLFKKKSNLQKIL